MLGEDEEQLIWKSRTPKIFRLMTRTTILALQSLGLGNEDLLALTIFLFLSKGGKQSLSQGYGNPSPYGGVL